MRFGLLGAVQVRAPDGRAVPVGGPRVRSLLALLLLNAGRVVTAEHLIDGVYGEDPPGGAANALQSQVSRLRRGLRDAHVPADVVEFHPAGYRLAVDADEVDALRFERLAGEGRRALEAGDHGRAAAVLRTALDLWRGPALADVAAAPFAAAQAARLEELRVAAVEDRAEAELTLGRYRDVAAYLREAVAAHPLRERLRGQLMRALYGDGRHSEALGEFEEARRTLADELGADPSPELTAVHLAVLRADPSLAAPPPAPGPGEAPAVRTGLTAQLTSFVGRADELARIGKLLATERLVTLIGPGGAGKTRLSIEAGGREQGDVCFVDLSQVEAAADGHGGPSGAVAQALIGALGIRETALLTAVPDAQPDSVARLVEALSDRRTLLILDNCEHVIDDAADLVHRLLGACPGLRVLATSREALGITGEVLCPLPPLAAPPPGTEPADALAYPAVRLFADRAAAVRPDLVVDASNLDDVLRICEALDGLPLAIELAAARLRSLSVGEIAARLGSAGRDDEDASPDDRFRLLSRGDRTKSARHRTLRAVVQWSWDLLSEDEQTLARRLTVFAGGAAPDAVARVCGLSPAAADELLADLTDKSLVENTGGRYRMLETVRAFGAERLAESGEVERMRAAHAAYFFDLIDTAEPHLRRAEQLEWLARLNTERANLVSALHWAVRADRTLALRMLAAMASYWWLRGLRVEGAAAAVELLERIGPEPPEGMAEEYALCLMIAAHGGADGPALRDHNARVRSIMLSLGADRPPLRPIITLFWAMNAGPSEENREIQQARMGWDPWSRALRNFGFAYMALFDGEVAEAEALFAEGERGFRELGDRWGLSAMLAEQGRIAGWRGDVERADALIDEAHALVRELDAAEDMADTLCLRAETLVRVGDRAGARACYERSLDLARRAGAPDKVADVQRGLAEVARLDGDLATARRLHEAALSRCQGDSFVLYQTRAMALLGLGKVAAAEGDPVTAEMHFREALTLGLGMADFRLPAHTAEALAGTAVLAGDGTRAALLLGAGVALRGMEIVGDPDTAWAAARARELIGDEAFATARASGTALSRDDALALVRAASAGSSGTGDAS